jgi:hypothetical protein
LVVAEIVQPKRFAGVFSTAPASLLLTSLVKGSSPG